MYVYRVLTFGGPMPSHMCTYDGDLYRSEAERMETALAQYYVFETRNPKVAGVWKKEQFCT